MIYSDQSALVLDTNSNEKREYEILKAHSVVCRLSKADKRALAEYLEHANHVGKSFYLALSRLISGKLHYAPDLDGTSPSHAIDKLRTQKGRLVYHEDYNPRHDDINMASLLGSTLTGMKPGQTAPFLQADGSFREVHLISVDH